MNSRCLPASSHISEPGPSRMTLIFPPSWKVPSLHGLCWSLRLHSQSLLFMLFIEVPYQLPNITISFKSLFNLFNVLSALAWRFYIFWSAIASFSFPLSPIIPAMAPSQRSWGTTEHKETEWNLEDLTTLIPQDCLGWKEVVRNRVSRNYQHLFSEIKKMFEHKDRHYARLNICLFLFRIFLAVISSWYAREKRTAIIDGLIHLMKRHLFKESFCFPSSSTGDTSHVKKYEDWSPL